MAKITLAGVDALTESSGVVSLAAATAIPSTVTFPAGHVVQTIMNYWTADFGTSSGTLVIFGGTSTAGAITITSGNHVLVTMVVNVYTAGDKGGFVHMCRGVGPGNNSSDMAQSSFKAHQDNMSYVSGMVHSQPHWYNTSGGHSYGMFTYQLLDTQLSRHTTPTQPRYSLGLAGHPSNPGITCGANWSYPVAWTLQEIQT